MKKLLILFSPPRLLEMASFVRETGTTSLAQTYEAAMQSRTTNPIPKITVGSGRTASNDVAVGDIVAAVSIVLSIVPIAAADAAW